MLDEDIKLEKGFSKMKSSKNAADRITEFDGLRGILALLIILFHYYCWFCDIKITNLPFSNWTGQFFLHCDYAVEVFFMLSGFLIAQKYEGDHIDGFQFFRKRFSIILPLSISNLMCYVENYLLAYVSSHKMQPLDLWYLFTSCTGISVGWIENYNYPLNSVTWFVDVLLLCYCIYYILANIRIKYPNTYICVTVGLVLLGYFIIQQKMSFPFFYKANGRAYACFFGGVLIEKLYDKGTIDMYRNYIRVSSVISFGLLVCACFTNFDYIFGDSKKFFIFIIAPIFFSNVLCNGLVTRILRNNWLVWLGGISSSIFFIHEPLLMFIKKILIIKNYSLNTKSWIVCLIVVVIAILGGCIFDFLLNRIHRVIRNKKTPMFTRNT